MRKPCAFDAPALLGAAGWMALSELFFTMYADVTDVYNLVLTEVEAPLLETVMNYVKGNQTKASELLGLNRGTLRKKLKQYDLL